MHYAYLKSDHCHPREYAEILIAEYGYYQAQMPDTVLD